MPPFLTLIADMTTVTSILEDSASVEMPRFAFMSLCPSSPFLFMIHPTEFRLEHIEENTRIQEADKTIIFKVTEVINKSKRRKKPNIFSLEFLLSCIKPYHRNCPSCSVV